MSIQELQQQLADAVKRYQENKVHYDEWDAKLKALEEDPAYKLAKLVMDKTKFELKEARRLQSDHGTIQNKLKKEIADIQGQIDAYWRDGGNLSNDKK